jgi:SAM-dependent methyltransferase
VSESIAFDRAADTYDQTRILSAEAKAKVEKLLAAELAGRGRCLEIGVGTGRIALPLVEGGVDVVGVDLSLPMLSKLVKKAGGASSFPLAQADATRLPFADGVFGAAYCVHVLHLIPNWREAVAELARVVRRPGGVVLVDLGGMSTVLDELHERLAREAGTTSRHPGLDAEGGPELDVEFARYGGRVRELPPIPEDWRMPLEGFITFFEGGVFSWSWSIREEERRRAAAAVRPWAEERFGPLDEPWSIDRTIRWRAYDLA